ncbi:MAG: hypothetical protein PHP00_06865 [Thiotrichaceae bacterium]|nr:hypothetical protein [Thiotrichaceae bacterium]
MSYVQTQRIPGSVVFKGNIAAIGDVPSSPAEGDVYHLTGDVTISGTPFATGNEILWTGSAWELIGKDGFTIKALTADGTLTAYDQVVTASGASAAVAVTLPAVSGVLGHQYQIKATDITNAVTIAPNGSDTIDGATGSYTFATAGDSLTITATAAGWIIQ